MTTKPYSFRLSEPAQRKLGELAQLYGSQTRALEVALDRLHTAEVTQRSPTLSDGCDASNTRMVQA